jgi:hypothetical protein
MALSDINQERSARQTISSPSLYGGQRNDTLAPYTEPTSFTVSPYRRPDVCALSRRHTRVQFTTFLNVINFLPSCC